jgi:putative flavoprotein involved in K+ transport
MQELKGFEEKKGVQPREGRGARIIKGRKLLARTEGGARGAARLRGAALHGDHRRRPGRHRTRRAAAAAGRPHHHHREEREAGDSWRNRYKSLCLHDPVWYDHLPYMKFPDDWPVFAAQGQDRRLAGACTPGSWSSTTGPAPKCTNARYDEARRNGKSAWMRDGEPDTLRPKQLVFALGSPATRTCRSSTAPRPSRASSTTPASTPAAGLDRARRPW